MRLSWYTNLFGNLTMNHVKFVIQISEKVGKKIHELNLVQWWRQSQWISFWSMKRTWNGMKKIIEFF